MFCFQCGEKIPDNSNYCMKCGAKIERVNSNLKMPSGEEIETLKSDFRKDMFTIYQEACKIGYRPSYFLQMISTPEDIVQIAKRLIAKETNGFIKLAELRRTDLSVENYVTLSKYAPLFSDSDREICRKRLSAYKF
ncbi:MAG: zinc-ribbon domain-containing protein [Clostridiaceae bacterium]|nr:zinc-ribbon domain-containing protein [Clostridiaceae bacterium]